MKHYVAKLNTNTAGQDAPSIAVYPDKQKAQVEYHNTLAAYHNADDVLYAVVMIITEDGMVIQSEEVDHRPEPEPEPEPEEIEE